MPTTRRSVLQCGGLALCTATAGCSSLVSGDSPNTKSSTTTTDYVQTPKLGYANFEVENNHAQTHELRVTVETEAKEKAFDRTLTLEPQREPEFNGVLAIPEEGTRTYTVHAEGVGEQSVTRTLELTADGEFQNVYVTINANGDINITQGTGPTESVLTTTAG